MPKALSGVATDRDVRLLTSVHVVLNSVLFKIDMMKADFQRSGHYSRMTRHHVM